VLERAPADDAERDRIAGPRHRSRRVGGREAPVGHLHRPGGEGARGSPAGDEAADGDEEHPTPLYGPLGSPKASLALLAAEEPAGDAPADAAAQPERHVVAREAPTAAATITTGSESPPWLATTAAVITTVSDGSSGNRTSPAATPKIAA
jgi:hypothetical protein